MLRSITLPNPFSQAFTIALILSLPVSFSYGQDLIVRNYDKEDGLVSEITRDVVRDSLGFVWFGGERGLTRFNGSSFKHYESEVGDPSSLYNTSVNQLHVDHRGRLWCSFHQGGLSRYDYASNRFEDYVYTYSDTSKHLIRSVWFFASDGEGKLLIRSSDGLNSRFNEKLDRFEVYEPWRNLKEVDGESVRAIFVDRSSHIWLQGRMNGKKSVAIYSVADNRILNQFSFSGFINKVVEWPENVFWFGTWGRGLKRYEMALDSMVSCLPGPGGYDLPGSVVMDLQPDEEGRLWITTDEGLVTLSKEQALVCRPDYHFVRLKDPYTNAPLSSWFEALHLDDDHRMWAGSLSEGIYAFDPTSFQVDLMRFSSEIVSDGIIGEADERGWYWFLLEDGLAHYNPKNEEFKIIRPQRKDTVNVLINDIVGMAKAPDGRLMVSFRGGEIALIDLYTYERDHFVNGSSPPFPTGILNSYKDKYGNTWVSTYRGLLRHTSTNFLDFDTVIAGHDGRNIAEDQEGGLWVASWNQGLVRIDLETLEHNWYDPNQGDGGGLLGSDAQNVRVTKDGNVWTLTSKGPQVLNPKTKRFEMIPRASEMSLLSSHLFTPDKNDDLWFSTSRGLYFWNRRADKLMLLDADYGLPGTEYGAIESMSDGRLYIDSEIGCLRIDPDEIPSPGVPEEPLFTEVKLESEDTTKSLSLIGLETVEASYRDNFIRFEFAPLNFSLNGKMKYEYMLDRGAGVWVEIGEATDITFLDLPSGNYSLRLRAKNDWGEYGPESELQFIVHPPWWVSNTAITIYVLIIIAGVVAYNQVRLHNLRRKQRILENIVEKRTEEIRMERDRSDKLLLNILPSEVAKELKIKGESEAKLIDEVTVLFTDFKGFTALSEKLSPRDLVRDLNECFSAFDRICEKYGIEKIKTIGDAYMAAGGLPTPDANHADHVIKAAFEMRDFIERGKQKKMKAGLPFFEIRIGIHSGPVVAGIVGVKKFQYDIWGDAVNTASRMESSGAVGRVNVSSDTYRLLKDIPEYNFEHRGKIKAKGKGEMEMWFVERSQEAATT